VVTICSASLTFSNSTFCPHSVFMWIWEQAAIIFLYSINWLVFITKTESVYCAVRAQYLHITSRLLDRAMAQAVSRRPLTRKFWVRSQSNPTEICGEKSGTGTGFFSNYIGFSLSGPLRQYCTLIFSYTLFLSEEQMGEAWNSSKKQCCFVNRRALDR